MPSKQRRGSYFTEKREEAAETKGEAHWRKPRVQAGDSFSLAELQNVHSSIIHNNQKMETQMPIN